MSRIIPTKIRPESLEEFKKLYTKKFGTILSDEEAKEEGLRLLRLLVVMIEQTEFALTKEDRDKK